MKSSSGRIKPPINTVPDGNFHLTSQPEKVQVLNPSYKKAPVVSAFGKSAQHNNFAPFAQINKPVTNNQVKEKKKKKLEHARLRPQSRVLYVC